MRDLTPEQTDLHLLIKDIYSTHDPLLHITTVADRAKLVDELIAAGCRKPRTITTAEELDALPVGSVILDPLGEAYQRMHNGDGPALWSAGDVVPSRLIILSATVLHEPEATL